MSLWTKVRDAVIKPIARAVIPGYAAAEAVYTGVKAASQVGRTVTPSAPAALPGGAPSMSLLSGVSPISLSQLAGTQVSAPLKQMPAPWFGPQPGDPFAAQRPGQAPSGYHLNKSDGKYGAAGTYYVRNRRMNVMNPRAAKRAIRRIKGALRLLRQIERQLPKQRARARAPTGHRARLTHQ